MDETATIRYPATTTLHIGNARAARKVPSWASKIQKMRSAAIAGNGSSFLTTMDRPSQQSSCHIFWSGSCWQRHAKRHSTLETETTKHMLKYNGTKFHCHRLTVLSKWRDATVRKMAARTICNATEDVRSDWVAGTDESAYPEAFFVRDELVCWTQTYWKLLHGSERRQHYQGETAIFGRTVWLWSITWRMAISFPPQSFNDPFDHPRVLTHAKMLGLSLPAILPLYSAILLITIILRSTAKE